MAIKRVFRKKRYIKDDDNSLIFGKRARTPYFRYCKSKNIKPKDRLTKDEIDIFAHRMFKEVATLLIESEGGVCMKNLGYFHILMARGPRYRRNRFSGKIKEKRGSNIWTMPRLLFSGADYEFRFWSMDYGFKKPIFEALREKYKSGKRYKAYYYTIRPYIALSQMDTYRPFYDENNPIL